MIQNPSNHPIATIGHTATIVQWAGLGTCIVLNALDCGFERRFSKLVGGEWTPNSSILGLQGCSIAIELLVVGAYCLALAIVSIAVREISL